ncbi:MAG: PTS fructose transporter subunit IIA, partial [Burkholderiaceae bacterium]|nr:PTS fructose transporter subunit IIA [Burkholderiaceae bacterium]
MNSIFIIAHAPLAHALRASVLHVFPDAHADIVALDVQPNVPPEETQASAKIMMAQLAGLPNINGTLVLTDVFGATPCNVALKLVDGLNSKLIAGVNLPMLLRAMTYRHESLDILVSRAVAGGIQGVMAVAITAPQNQTLKPHDKNNHDH